METESPLCPNLNRKGVKLVRVPCEIPKDQKPRYFSDLPEEAIEGQYEQLKEYAIRGSRVPIIAEPERGSKFDTPEMRSIKLLCPDSATIGTIQQIIRNKLKNKLKSSEALFILLHQDRHKTTSIQPCINSSLRSFSEGKDFLYITFACEKTFG